MVQKKRCKHCNKIFKPNPRVPNQQYCSDPKCQKARKREWQKRKLEEDEDYRQNQKDAQKRWRQKNPDYWKEYRKKNQEYTDRNKERQAARNNNRKMNVCKSEQSIAKMDMKFDLNNVTSGIYKLFPVTSPEIAKMDPIIVKIEMIAGS